MNNIYSEDKKILFSIITISYNSSKTLEKTIKSVLNQTYPHIEYIIVDGGSTDDTIDLIKKYQGKITKWISEKDRGISDAMNKGIEMASGDIIGIIHADDWYEANAVENVVNTFISTDADVVCGKVTFYKNEKPELTYESVPELLEKEMTVQHPSTFIRRRVYEKDGSFNLIYKYAMDYDLLLRLKLKGYKFKSINNVIANMRYEGKSDKNWLVTLSEARNIKISNGISAAGSWAYFAKQLVRMSVSRTLIYLKMDFWVNLYRKHFSIVKKHSLTIDGQLNQINILFVSSRADVGGGPLQMFDLISNIDRNKFTPFAAMPYEKPFYERVKAAEAKTLPIKKRVVSIFDYYELVKFAYSNDIDIVHSHGKGAGVYSRLLKLFCPRVKIVHTFHGFHYDNMPKLKEWLHKSAEKLLSRFTDMFVNVSEGEQLQYALGGLLDYKRSVLIKNLLPLDSLKRVESALKSNKFSVQNKDGKIYFCAVARFDPVKQMPFLVGSFIKACNNSIFKNEVKLMLVGDGEEYSRCRKIADEMNAGSFIEFLGEVPDALEIMAKCDIYISTSRREGLSLSMLEAAACGLPILAPRVSGIAEVVRPYEKGILFENNDYKSFEFGMALAVENFKLKWKNEQRLSSPDFEAKYEAHKQYIKKYEKLYIETLNSK